MFGRLKYGLIIWVLFFSTGANLLSQPAGEEISARKNSCLNFIHITGESNVNQFSFNFNQGEILSHSRNNSSDSADVIIRIPIREFRASNQMMYSDFLEMMKESEYPTIEICFKRKQLNRAHTGDYGSCPDIRITIAGVTRIYKIDCSILPCANNMFIQGEKKLKLTDFHLKPPVKLKGLVKVSDDINVNFGFMITFADENPLSIKL
jgi:hypothetical protein